MPKKRKKHHKSIMQPKDGTCYLCGKLYGDYRIRRPLHEHHVFGGSASRALSEEYGLKVYLCIPHHLTGKEAVHLNADIMRMLREDGQRAFEREYPDLDFMQVFGKNYL